MNAKTIFPLWLALVLALSMASNSFAGANEGNVGAMNPNGSQAAQQESGSLDSSSLELDSVELDPLEIAAIFGGGALVGAGALIAGLLALIL